MLKITKKSDHRVDIELNGSIDADAMRDGLDKMLAASEDVKHGVMLYTISEFSLPTLGAIAVEMSRVPKLFGLLGKFDRCAVLTDSKWLGVAAEVEGALFPGIEIKSFALDDQEPAEAWLNEETA